jgi:hypothetical protein
MQEGVTPVCNMGKQGRLSSPRAGLDGRVGARPALGGCAAPYHFYASNGVFGTAVDFAFR